MDALTLSLTFSLFSVVPCKQTEFRQLLACLNTILESCGKLTFLESGSAVSAAGSTGNVSESRRFRVVPAADIEDDPLDITTSSSTAAAADPTLPTVWVSPNETRFVFPAAVGVNGFRAASGQPVNPDITLISGTTSITTSASGDTTQTGFKNPHLFELLGRAAPLRIHFDPAVTESGRAAPAVDATELNNRFAGSIGAGKDPSEFDPVTGKHVGVVVGIDGQPIKPPAGSAAAAAAAAGGDQSESDADSDSDFESDVIRPPAQQAAAPVRRAAAPTGAPTLPKRADALSAPLVHGVVWKASGALIRSWLQRYIVLQGRYIFKYEHMQSSIAAMLGHPIPIDQCTITAADDIKAEPATTGTTHGPQSFLRLTSTAAGPKRVWELGVLNAEVRDHWISDLLRAQKLVVQKVAGAVKWSDADLNANKIAELANHTQHH